MRIAYVVPGVMETSEMNRRENLLQSWAFSNAKVEVVGVSEGPASIESKYEEYLSIPAASKKIYQLEKEGYDAVILGCAGDPGLDGIREITNDMLVTGPGQSSMQLAVMLGKKFSVLTVEESAVDIFTELAYKAGVKNRLSSVKSLDIPVLDLSDNKEQVINKLIKKGQTAVKEDRADVLILGCMSLGFLEVAEKIEDQLDVPVINPSKTSLKITEAFVDVGLSHSKQAFMTPPKIKNGEAESIEELYVSSK